jgi:hypothetical protein
MNKQRRYGPLLPSLADLNARSRKIGLASRYGVLVILLVDTILIGYVLVSVIFRLQIAGLTLIDSLPIAMYVLPLFVFLSLIIRGHYREISKIPSVAVLLIAGVIFALISPLGIGFLVVSTVNFISSCWLIVTSTVTVEIDRSSVNRKTIAYLLLLNLIGLLFPASVYLMGRIPITTVSYSGNGMVYFELDINEAIYNGGNLNNGSILIQDLKDTRFGLEFVIRHRNNISWDSLSSALENVTSNGIAYSITLDANRSDLVVGNPSVLGTNEVIAGLYQRYSSMLFDLVETLNSSHIESKPNYVLFDMTLSPEERALFMNEVRQIDLYGFSNLVSSTITAMNQTSIERYGTELRVHCEEYELSPGLIVNSFVLDDAVDGDSSIMLACGVTRSVFDGFPSNQIDCLRSSFSTYMEGDVGEYLCYAFSSLQGSPITRLRLGEIMPSPSSNQEQIDSYNEIGTLADDIAISLGNGAQSVTVVSLPQGLSLFGSEFLTNLKAILESISEVPITYTFRIYALRAVLQAVDAFI